MKIENIVQEILLEEEMEIKNKGLFNRLVDKWRNQCPDLSNEDMVKIFKRHDTIKNSITEDLPAVISFLRRYDGQHGAKKYTLQNLRDITSIEIGHLVEFLIEFGKFYIEYPCSQNQVKLNNKEAIAQIRKTFNENGNKKTPEKIELSKKMWYDESTAIVNDGGLRVYSIMNQEQSIWMGYYYQTIHKKNYIQNDGVGLNAPWCVTWRGTDVQEYKEDKDGKPFGQPLFSHASNMYGNYRNIHKRTFYFIIDDNKPETNKYHMSALQIQSNGAYVLSSMFNDRDAGMSWDEIVRIYPKIENHKDKIKYRQMDDDEIQAISIVDRINEIPGSPNEFARQNQNTKDEYLSNGGTLKEVVSWRSMNNDLRTKYIDLTTAADVLTRFSTYDFLQTVVTTPGYDKKLSRRLEIVGFPGGAEYILNNLLKTEFVLLRKSIDKQHIGVYEKRGTGDYGLMNFNTLTWVNFEGVKYDATFKIKDYATILDESGATYYLELLIQNGTGKKLFLVTPLDKGNGIDTYVISDKNWTQIKDKFTEVDKFVSTSKDFEPEKHTDVNEKKRV